MIHFDNGFTLHLHCEGERFCGIGAVYFQDRLLRSSELPWTFYTESESTQGEGGWRFEEFTLRGVEQGGDRATIEYSSRGCWMPRMQAADAMGDARVATRRLKAPEAVFRWHFKSIEEQIEENVWPGLAMQLEISSPHHPVHWVIEATTWEIGGEAACCVLIQQDVSTIDLEQKVEAGSAFSTIEKFFTQDAGAWGGSYPMDMLPRAAGAAICDFQVKGDLALCLWAEQPGLTRARLEKFADENVIHYTDRAFIPLSEKAIFPERKLLVHRHQSTLMSHEWRNLWLDCFTHARRQILDHYGFEVEHPRPHVRAHLWDEDLKRFGAAWTEPLKAAMPDFARLGYKEVFTHGVWESVTSDPNPVEDGNICCPYEFTFAEEFGGAAGMKSLTDAAHANDMELYQWFSFHLSKHAKVWQEHPDWVLREANGDPWDGNYGSLWSGRMRSGYGQWFEDAILRLHQQAGLDGLFLDSYQNLGVTGIDWGAPDKAPQADEIWKMQARWQRQGFRQAPEVVTIFGVSQVAMYGFENDQFRRRLWSDTVRNDDAFALLDCAPAFFSDSYPFTQERLSPQHYFYLAAHRVLPNISARPWPEPADPSHAGPALPGGVLCEEYARVNHLYNAALPRMVRPRLQPGGTHILWLDESGKPSVIWAFADMHWEGNNLTDCESGEPAGAMLRAGRVYRYEV
jgi:hypothetical protein